MFQCNILSERRNEGSVPLIGKERYLPHRLKARFLKKFDGDSLTSYLQCMTVADLKQLPVAERLRLVEDLWDTIAEETSPITLSSEQKAELDHRLDAMEENPKQGVSWTIVRDRILGSL